jgi:hypothetical protein
MGTSETTSNEQYRPHRGVPLGTAWTEGESGKSHLWVPYQS